MTYWDEAYYEGAVTVKADSQEREVPMSATLKTLSEAERAAQLWMFRPLLTRGQRRYYVRHLARRLTGARP